MRTTIHPAFEDKVIVVTGASNGSGAALARQLASSKPRLMLAARRRERVRAARSRIGIGRVPIAPSLVDRMARAALARAASR